MRAPLLSREAMPAAVSSGIPLSRGLSSRQLAATIAASAVIGAAIAASQDWKLAAGLLAMGILGSLGLFRPVLFIAIFLLVRPLLENQLPVGDNATGAVAVVLVAMFAALLVTRRDLLTPQPTLALVAVVLVSCMAAAESVVNFPRVLMDDAIGEVARLTALLAIFLLAANLLAEKVRMLAVVIGLSGVIPAIFGIHQLLTGSVDLNENTGLLRVNGTFDGPNPFGTYLAFTVLTLMALPKGWIKPWVRYPALVLMLVPLTATYSRAGWALLILGVVVLWWRERPALVGAVALGVALVVWSVPAVHDRLLPAADQGALVAQEDETYESFGWRVDNWEALLEKWQERPLQGYGLETTQYVNPRVPVDGAGRADGGYDAHNMGVRILVEGGIVLLVVYVIFFVAVLRTTRKQAKARWELRPIARLVWGLWFLSVVIGLTTGDPLNTTALMFPLLALTGAVAGAWAKHKATSYEDEAHAVASENGHMPARHEAPSYA